MIRFFSSSFWGKSKEREEPLRLELQSNQTIINDPFMSSFQQALTEHAGKSPTLKGCPTLRVNVSRPSEDELDETFTLHDLNLPSCAVFSFELFDTTGNKHPIPDMTDGTLRAYHYAFGDSALQMLFDGLPGFDGTSSRPDDYANTAARFIFDHLAH